MNTRRRIAPPDPALLTRAGLVVIAFVVLMYVNRDQWFHAEEWYSLSYARDSASWWDWLLAPYNGHLIALPSIEFRLLRDHVGLHAYWPYATVLVLSHLAVVVLLWRIAVRAGADTLVATATALPIAVLGVGSENLLWAFLVTIVGGVAFGLAAIEVASGGGSLRRDVAAVALALLSLLCSGIGVVMVFGLALLGWLRDGPFRALRLAIVPAVLYVAWRAAYPYHEPLGLSRWGEIPRLLEYVVRGVSAAFDSFLFDVPYLGAIAFVAVVAYALARVRDVRGRAAPAYALAASAIVLLFATGSTRIKLGVEQGNESRYTYVVVALAVPLCALVLTRLSRDRSLVRAAIIVGAIAVAAYNLDVLNTEAKREAAAESDVRDVVLAVAYLTAKRPEESIRDAVAEPVLRVLTVRDLQRLGRNDLLPDLRPPDQRLALNLAPHVLVGLEPRPAVPDERCRTVAAGETVRIPTGAGRLEIPFRSDGRRELVISLRDPALGATSGNREIHWRGGPGTVVVLRSRAIAALAPTDGPVQLCLSAAARSTSAIRST